MKIITITKEIAQDIVDYNKKLLISEDYKYLKAYGLMSNSFLNIRWVKNNPKREAEKLGEHSNYMELSSKVYVRGTNCFLCLIDSDSENFDKVVREHTPTISAFEAEPTSTDLTVGIFRVINYSNSVKFIKGL